MTDVLVLLPSESVQVKILQKLKKIEERAKTQCKRKLSGFLPMRGNNSNFIPARPRENIVQETIKQLEREQITGKLIHLCFTCDPYPTGYDTATTREIIKVLKAAGNHVQILTKGDGSRDFDLLDENDWYGITYDGLSRGPYSQTDRLVDVYSAWQCGIRTWCSFEPVIDPADVLDCIENSAEIFDKVKIGKLNYHPSNINWAKFGSEAEALCKKLGIDYYIKDSLRKEMEAQKGGAGNG